MKSRIMLAGVLVAAAAGVVGWQLTRSGGSSAKEPAAGTVATAGTAAPAEAPLLRAAPAPSLAVEAPGGAAAAPAPPPPSGDALALSRDGTVVTVNGVALRGADVMAFRKGAPNELAISAEMHEFLTQRAIDRELTMQAAQARGLELSAAQQQQLAQVRANAEERGEADPAQLAFEEKEARAQLLLEELVKAEGGPPALADDAAVDRYLREHASELGPLPDDPEAARKLRIDVRQKLFGQLAAAHQERVRAYLAQLAAAARVER